jgi:hypothetical protein
LILVSVIIGTLIGIGYKVSAIFPVFGTWYSIILYGIVLGISASGLYDFTRRMMLQSAATDGK